ncbi:TAXI family TRAP transporter solute-binding subunit [Methylolobus aquaticus]
MNDNRLRVVILGALSVATLIVFAVVHYRNARNVDVTIAAGNLTGESYLLASALKTVLERHHPEIRVQVLETGGTTDSLRRLEQGQASIAAAQADVPVGPSARLVANLYPDAFQLVVREGTGIRSFVDLSGKRIALARRGGQFQSFLSVAAHFGLKPADFEFLGDDDQSADRALLEGRADAAFRVRAIGNSAIEHLVRAGRGRLIEIPQAAAMRIRWVAFEASVVPMGAYLGNPPIPDRDLPTVAVSRTLVAHADLPDEVVYAIAETLAERRQEIAQAIPEAHALARPLLASISAPHPERGLDPETHPGARKYYEKDKPSYFEEYADFMALLLTMTVLSGSWIWQLRRWMAQKRKNRADEYIHRVIELMRHAQICDEPGALEAARLALFDLLHEAVGALDTDQLSPQAFQSFRGVWQIARDVVAERTLVVRGDGTPPLTASVAD